MNHWLVGEDTHRMIIPDTSPWKTFDTPNPQDPRSDNKNKVFFSEVEYQIPPSKWLPIFSNHSPTQFIQRSACEAPRIAKARQGKLNENPLVCKSYQIIYIREKIAASKPLMVFRGGFSLRRGTLTLIDHLDIL